LKWEGAGKEGKPEDLLIMYVLKFAVLVEQDHADFMVDKKRYPRINLFWSGDFCFLRQEKYILIN